MRIEIRLIAALLIVGWSYGAQAFVVNITPSSTRTIYLRVGDGAITGGNFNSGGTPQDMLGTPNKVSVTVPAASVGNGTTQAMTGTGSLISHYDGFAFCDAGQTYIGGFYRHNGSGGAATLSVAVTTPLQATGGLVIPFSQISWTTEGNSDTGAGPIPNGSFNASTQTLATFPVNTWRETCFKFSYANSSMYAAGTYEGRVTYTLANP
jgi:hypothetical protein